MIGHACVAHPGATGDGAQAEQVAQAQRAVQGRGQSRTVFADVAVAIVVHLQVGRIGLRRVEFDQQVSGADARAGLKRCPGTAHAWRVAQQQQRTVHLLCIDHIARLDAGQVAAAQRIA